MTNRKNNCINNKKFLFDGNIDEQKERSGSRELNLFFCSIWIIQFVAFHLAKMEIRISFFRVSKALFNCHQGVVSR